MDAMIDASDSQMAVLADLVESLAAADATVNAMMAARDGLLALAGRVAADIARQGDHPDGGDMTMRTVAAEIGQRLRVSDRTVERRIAEASCLVDGFPTVWSAQGAGRISAGHAHVIIEAGAHLADAAQREAYVAAVLPLAEVESPNRLRPLARRIAERFQEVPVDERHRAARTRRRVWSRDQDDAMADLTLHGPAVLVHAMMDRLSQMAHRIRTENLREAKEARSAGIEFDADPRSVDEIRADLLADLVLTGAPTGHDSADGLLAEIRGRIEITVPVTTLMGEDLGADAGPVLPCEHSGAIAADADLRMPSNDSGGQPTPDVGAEAVVEGAGSWASNEESGGQPTDDAGVGTDADTCSSNEHGETNRSSADAFPPALLDGTIPIDARTARLLAGTATGWDRVLTHPLTGAVLAADRYRPPEQLRRHLRARDQRCRFPTCGLASRKCDLDHNDAAATGGPTTEGNLSAFCRRHHTLKHASPWHVRQRAGGVLEWTSPTGRTYVDTPPPPNTVVFAPTSSGSFDSFASFVDSARAPF